MNLRKVAAFLGASVLVLAASPAMAQKVIDFDAITTAATVDDFYNGGTDSLGETGPNYGVSFQAGDWATTGGFGQTTPPNLAYSLSGTGYVNFNSGFSNQLSFSYGAFSNAQLSIYSGANGTGTLLGTYALPTNDPNAFSPVSLSFSGTAHSAVLSSGASQFGWDDLKLGGGAPEPATWGMMLLGFGATGAALRRRKTQRVRFAIA